MLFLIHFFPAYFFTKTSFIFIVENTYMLTSFFLHISFCRFNRLQQIFKYGNILSSNNGRVINFLPSSIMNNFHILFILRRNTWVNLWDKSTEKKKLVSLWKISHYQLSTIYVTFFFLTQLYFNQKCFSNISFIYFAENLCFSFLQNFMSFC